MSLRLLVHELHAIGQAGALQGFPGGRLPLVSRQDIDRRQGPKPVSFQRRADPDA